MTFDLWDIETNQYLGQYSAEIDALVLVRTLVSNFGPEYANDLELGGVTDEGEAVEPLSGVALIERANRVLARQKNMSAQEAEVVGANRDRHGPGR